MKKLSKPVTRAEALKWAKSAYPSAGIEIEAFSSLGKPRWRLTIINATSGNPFVGGEQFEVILERAEGTK